MSGALVAMEFPHLRTGQPVRASQSPPTRWFRGPPLDCWFSAGRKTLDHLDKFQNDRQDVDLSISNLRLLKFAAAALRAMNS